MKARSAHSYKQSFKALSDKFNFGKYKGDTIEDIIKIDPGYILWAHDEKVAKFTEEILQYAEEAEDEEYYNQSMDYNDRGIDMYDFMAD